MRRPCLEEVGVFNESLQVSEDFELWLRIASCWDVAVVPEVLAVREKRREGLSLSTRPDKYLEDGIAALKNEARGVGRSQGRFAVANRRFHGCDLLRTQFTEKITPRGGGRIYSRMVSVGAIQDDTRHRLAEKALSEARCR